MQCERCHYITFKAKPDAGKNLLFNIRNIISRDGLDTFSLVTDGECPIFDKFDEYIPPELLREAYATDRLLADEVLERFE